MSSEITSGETFPPAAECSRAGCRNAAQWRIEWRNPRIHAADRRKTWVACEEHRAFLHDYLAARDFPVSASPLTQDAPIEAEAS